MEVLFLSSRSPSPIRHFLVRLGVRHTAVPSCEEASEHLDSKPYDVLLVEHTPDMRIPDIEVLATRARLRKPDVTVIVISGAALQKSMRRWAMLLTEQDATSSLERLLAAPATNERERLIDTGTVQVDRTARTVTLQGAAVDLTATEYLLIELLAENTGRLFTRSEILDRIWPAAFQGDTRIVDAYIKRLRKKLGDDVIETVRGLGYRIPTPQDADVPNVPELGARFATDISEALTQTHDIPTMTLTLQEHLSQGGLARHVRIVRRGGPVLAASGTARPADVEEATRTLLDVMASDSSADFRGRAPHHAAHAVLKLTRRDDDPVMYLVVVRGPDDLAWTDEERTFLELVSALVRPVLLLWSVRSRMEAQVALGTRRDFLFDFDAAIERARRTGMVVDLLLFERRPAPVMNSDDETPSTSGSLERQLREWVREGDRVYQLKQGVFGVILTSTHGESSSVLPTAVAHLQDLLNADGPQSSHVRGALVRFPEHGRSLSELLDANLDGLSHDRLRVIVHGDVDRPSWNTSAHRVRRDN